MVTSFQATIEHFGSGEDHVLRFVDHPEHSTPMDGGSYWVDLLDEQGLEVSS